MGIFDGLLSLISVAAPEPLPEPAMLIDVRSPAEFGTGHIEEAVLLPLNFLAPGIGGIATDKTAPIIVYCQSGARSASARKQLLGMGYTHVVNGGGLHGLAARMNRKIIR